MATSLSSIVTPITKNVEVNFENIINIKSVMVSYSPIIITMCIILLSAFSQRMQGITFFLFLFVFSFIRNIILSFVSSPPPPSNNKECVKIPVFSVYTNDGFNIFYITYLYIYLIGPMFMLVPMNYVLIILLGLYLVYIYLEAGKSGCVSGIYIFGNCCYGILSSILTLVIIMSCNLTQQLFLYDSVSDAVKCSKPSQQSFKCSVYQNGQLISSNTTSSNMSTTNTTS
jgi:hypothetical protein